MSKTRPGVLARIAGTVVIAAAALGVVAVPAPSAQPVAPPPAEQVVYTPNSSYQLALGDMAGIPPKHQPYIRYLSLHNLTPEDRVRMGQTVSFVVNSVSTRKKIQIPFFVGAGDRTVIRINLRDYDIDPKDWDRVGAEGSGPKPLPEPYFHAYIEPIATKTVEARSTQVTTKKVKVTEYRDERVPHPNYPGQYYIRKVPYEVEKEVPVEQENIERVQVPVEAKGKRKLVDAPWLDPQMVAQLKLLTQSEFPVMRADWFVTNAVLPPAYYGLLKLGNKLADFDRLVGADEKLAGRVRGQDKASVVQSTVARNNRTLTRSFAATGGYYWISHDTLKSVDDRQYAINLLKEKFDATEVIATLPNKLQVYFVTNGQLERQDFAPPDIAVDDTAIDRVVRNGRSCMICHSDGIRPIDDEVRAITDMLRNPDKVKLLIADDKDADEIHDLFGTDLPAQVFLDAQMYRKAVAEATGLTSEKNAQQLAVFYNQYAESLLTEEVAARDCGLSVEDFRRLLPLSKDNVVLGFTRTPKRPVRRDQWERSYSEFMQMIIAAKSKPAVPVPVPAPQPADRDPFGGGGAPAATPAPLEPKKAEPAVPAVPAAEPRKDDDPPPAKPIKKDLNRDNIVLASTQPVAAVRDEDDQPKPAPPAYFNPSDELKAKIEKAMGQKPAEPKKSEDKPKDPNVVAIKILMPNEHASLWIEGKYTEGAGPLVRRYFTPPLPPGQPFGYRVKAVWTKDGKAVGTEKQVIFRAGDGEVTADLR